MSLESHRSRTLWELAGFFSRLGFAAFGGPAAHIAMMEQEAVRKRGWLTHEAFLDLLGACNLIPGPSSTESGFPVLSTGSPIVTAAKNLLPFAFYYLLCL